MSGAYIGRVSYNTTTIAGITSGEVSPNVSVSHGQSDGEAYPRMVVFDAAKPAATFTTLRIADAITALGLTGLELGTYPLNLYTVLAAHGGMRASTGTKFSFLKGIVVPMRIEATQKGDASIQYQVFAGAADGSAPYTITDGQTLPLVSTDNLDILYRAGDVTVDGTSVGTVLGFTIDFGVTVRQEIGDGPWPNLVTIETYRPTITIRSRKPGAAAQITTSGDDGIVVMTLAAFSNGGGLTSASDLGLTTHVNYVHVSRLSGSNSEFVTTEITATPVYDGTNAPITVVA